MDVRIVVYFVGHIRNYLWSDAMTTEPETRVDDYGNVHTQASDICMLCLGPWPCTANIKWLEGEISSASETTAHG
jgi:hypothetical protein